MQEKPGDKKNKIVTSVFLWLLLRSIPPTKLSYNAIYRTCTLSALAPNITLNKTLKHLPLLLSCSLEHLPSKAEVTVSSKNVVVKTLLARGAELTRQIQTTWAPLVRRVSHWLRSPVSVRLSWSEESHCPPAVTIPINLELGFHVEWCICCNILRS